MLCTENILFDHIATKNNSEKWKWQKSNLHTTEIIVEREKADEFVWTLNGERWIKKTRKVPSILSVSQPVNQLVSKTSQIHPKWTDYEHWTYRKRTRQNNKKRKRDKRAKQHKFPKMKNLLPLLFECFALCVRLVCCCTMCACVRACEWVFVWIDPDFKCKSSVYTLCSHTHCKRR